MSLPLAIFILALATPLFFGKRGAWWLVLQAAALVWLELFTPAALDGTKVALVIDTVVLRGLIAPVMIHRAQNNDRDRQNHLYPSNLFVWTIAVLLFALGFIFAAAITQDPSTQLTFGAMISSILLAVLLLATNEARSTQLLAILFIENALALFELRLPEQGALLHLAGSLIYLGTIALFVRFMAEDPGREASEAPREVL
ncbi:MAG: hypothetical protein U1E65_02265 [Myxococcota bacterium]